MKEAGRPLPEFSEDDVVDYLVCEAVTLKAQQELEAQRKEAEKEREREQFRGSHKRLAQRPGR